MKGVSSFCDTTEEVVSVRVPTEKSELRQEVFDILSGNLVWFFGKGESL